MSSDKQALVRRIEALYERLQSNTLTPADFIPREEVVFPDYADAFSELYESRQLFGERFADFIPTFDIFRAFRDESSTVLDVGAHFGYSAIAMRWHGCASKIVAFDAMPSNATCLARIKSLEGERYDYMSCAIGKSPGNLRMFLPVMNGIGITAIASTGATLSEYFAPILAQQADTYRPQSGNGEDDVRIAILDVPARSLDDIMQSRGASERIVAIKMDLEGHEGPAVEGAAQIFSTMKPLLMIEGANRDPAVRDVMRSYGYEHYERHDGVLRQQEEFSLAQDGFWVHPERLEEYRVLGICSAAGEG